MCIRDRCRTVRLPSVDVDCFVPATPSFIKQKTASRTRCRCDSDSAFQSAKARRRFWWLGHKIKFPRPQMARSALAYWLATSERRFSTRSGSLFRLHCCLCLRTWFMLSHALLVHWLQPKTHIGVHEAFLAWLLSSYLSSVTALHCALQEHARLPILLLLPFNYNLYIILHRFNSIAKFL